MKPPFSSSGLPRLLLLWAVGLLAFGGCKKDPESTAALDPKPQAHVYELGTPTGSPAVKTIGPAGGTITSPDGRLSVTVPAGTVSAAIEFSVQPITNTLPLGVGGAYRLRPENLTFAKPVTITFRYSDADLEGSTAAAAFLAFQNKEGYWKLLRNTTLDETNKTLTVQSTHFSDWGMIEQVRVKAGKSVLEPKESTQLTLEKAEVVDDDLLSHILILSVLPSDINWRNVSNVGVLSPAADNSQATFTAPDVVPSPNRVLIETSIKEIYIESREASTGKLFLITPITIDDNYLAGKIGDKTFYMPNVNVIKMMNYIWVQATDPTNGDNILMLIDEGANGPGMYTYGELGKGGQYAEIRFMSGNKTYYSDYMVCLPPPAFSVRKYSAGGVKFNNFPANGELMDIGLSGTLYHKKGNCDYEPQEISGKLRGLKAF